MNKLELQDRFNLSFHKQSTESHMIAKEAISQNCLHLAEQFVMAAPDGRELSIALTKLEEALLWIKVAIDRHD